MHATQRTLIGVVGLALAVSLAACGDDDNFLSNTATPTPRATPTPVMPTPQEPTRTPLAVVDLCATAPHDQLCSFIPHTVIETIGGTGYSQLSPMQQMPFDVFSWQTFVALNWPAMPDGTPLDAPINSHPDAPRVWNSYADVFEVFNVESPTGLKGSPDACAALGAPDLPVLQLIAKSNILPAMQGSILQATEQPLIDRNLNFVLYDIRMN